MTQRNQLIDLLKLIFSIFIIGIHGQLFKNTIPIAYYTITMGLLRIAVPFFFAVSGYYFYKRLQQHQPIKPYFIKLIKIFCIFELLEIIIFSPFVLTSQTNIFLYIWRIISTGLGGAYWYLTSLLLSLLIMLPFWKKKKIMPCLMIGLILYLFCMTNDSYSSLFIQTDIQKLALLHTQIWTWPQAGLCSSLFYLSIGALIRQYPIKIKKIHYILVVSLLGLLFESYVLQSRQAYDGNCYLSLIVLTPSLLIYCLQHPYIGFDTKRLGQMSLYIYMMHQIVLNALQFLLPLPKGIIVIIVILICLCVSYLLTGRQKNGNT